MSKQPNTLKTIAIDFDGVIHTYDKGWQNGEIYGEPIEGALNYLIAFVSDGYSVFIHTTRNAEQVQAWMKGKCILDFEIIADDVFFWNKVGVVGISNRKHPAIVYIDDRAIRFESWEQTIRDFNRLHRKAGDQ